MEITKFVRISVLVLLILLGYQWLTAAYLTDIPVQVNQPDSTLINCFASGDEYHNWLHDANGFTIIQSPDTGYYTYAIQNGDTIVASNLIVGQVDPLLAGLTPGINISDAEYQQRRAETFPTPETRSAPTTGIINNIVIFISFSDCQGFYHPISTYEGWCNNNTCSLKNYFQEASYGQLTINSTFYPTQENNVVVSWQAPHTRTYYLSHENEERELLADAVIAVHSQIPSELIIDANSDGRVDNVVFIFSGNADSSSSMFWPHHTILNTENVEINGKRVYDYNLQIAGHMLDYSVGVLCHEFFHTLGAPDLYHRLHNHPLDVTPVGPWDLMASTANPPQHMGAYMKWKYGGWIPTIPEISSYHEYTLNPVTSPTDNVFRINSPYSTRYCYIAEYRNKSGTYEYQLPGSGMLIYRIDTDEEVEGNYNPPDEVYVYRPDGTPFDTGDINSAHYSAESGRTEISRWTNPSPFIGYTGEDGLIDGGLEIHQIGSAGATISFHLGPPPSTIRGTVSLNTTDQSDLVLTTIKLRIANSDELIEQKNPNPDGSYSFSAYPGSYYLEFDLFQPSLNRFCYKVLSNQIDFESGTNIIEVPLVTLTMYSMNSILVSSDASNPYFKSISQAVDFIQEAVSGGYNGNSVTVDILPGIYYWPQSNNQSVFYFNYTNTANDALEVIIRGSGNGIILEPEYNENVTINSNRTHVTFQNIKFTRSAQNCDYHLVFHGTNGSNYTFIECLFGKQDTTMNYESSARFNNVTGISLNNCDIQNNDNGGNGFGVLRFQGCYNVDINSCNFTQNVSSFGGAVNLAQTSNVQVRNSLFEFNNSVTTGSDTPAGTPGSAIYILESINVRLENNRFLNNHTRAGGGAVYLKETSQIHIESNLFKDNTTLPVGSFLALPSDALGFEYCAFTESDSLLRNIIHSGPGANHFVSITGDCSGTLSIANGVFIKGINDCNSEKKIVASFAPVNMTFTNCIFQTGDINASFESCAYPPQPTIINVMYSFYDNDLSGVTNATHNSNYSAVEMQLDSDYVPIWNSDTISPCIDAGIGENDPVDDTPPDIGARRAVSHDYWDYTFATQADAEKWYWVSYPVLNSRTDNQLKASIFFNELLETHLEEVNGIPWPFPTFLEEIDWMELGDPTGIQWNLTEHDWSPNQSTHYVSSPQGYKIKLLPRTPRLVTLKESGFRTPSDLEFTIYGGVGKENWLGYFKEDPAWPHEAFAPIWDDINMIKTKDWCLIHARTDGDYWGMSGKVRPLEYGDMVVVTTNNNHDFQWNNSSDTLPDEKSAPEHFVFNEKPDYVPVYVSIPDSIKIDLKEIGLYLDGVCKGAVVVEDSLEQICAYLDIDENLSNGVVEFVFYYNENKAGPQESKKIHLDSSRLSAQYIKGNKRYPYYNISLSAKDMDNVIPTEFALGQNYPNPFNPSTTISYQLKESGKVYLEIYNLRGQLVKSLVVESQEAGYHSMVWNGTDNKNRNVASGVYLYRLKCGNNVQTKRMLLMK